MSKHRTKAGRIALRALAVIELVRCLTASFPLNAQAQSGFSPIENRSPAISQVTPVFEWRLQTESRAGYWLSQSHDSMLWSRVKWGVIGDGSEMTWVLRPSALAEEFFRIEPMAVANLDQELEQVLSRHKVPGLAVAVVRSNAIVGLGAAGRRKWDVEEKVTVWDKFHIGSCTKSMTASLAAMLVEEGKIRWSDTILGIFPELESAMHADYRSVTLEQLLVHRAGVPSDLSSGGLWDRLWRSEASPREQRLQLLREVLAEPPIHPPGTKYAYSNAGYSIAGAMLEKVTGVPWEELIAQRLFRPLGMTSAGFGPPATPRHLNQPWGHVLSEGVLRAVPPGPAADNPPAIGPGGTVHCSIIDLARYAAWHVEGDLGRAELLDGASFQFLHRAAHAEDRYGPGWSLAERPWAGGTALTHTGTNNQWYTVMWLAPNREFAVVVSGNLGGEDAFAALDETSAAMIERFLGR